MTSLILYGLLSLLGTFLLTVIACLAILPICANARLTPFERLGQATYVLTIAGLQSRGAKKAPDFNRGMNS